MNISRRTFLGTAGAAVSFSAFGAPGEGRPDLKLALFSDPHVQDQDTQEKIRRLFGFAKANGVDGVLIAGDIANDGRDDQLKLVADAWFSVFPDSRNEKGDKVEIIGCYGNRDFRQSSVTKPGQREREAAISIFSHPNAIWEELFHEPIGDDFIVREVKGYPVVVAHWGFQNKLDVRWPEISKRIDPKKPFFYVQHPHLAETVFGLKADAGVSRRILSDYPNAIALSGHSHRTITDERALWRGSFLSIAGGSGALVSPFLDRPYENLGRLGAKKRGPMPRIPHMPENARVPNLSQIMILSLYPDRIEITRHDCGIGEKAGPDWMIPMPFAGNPAQPFGATAEPGVPQFPAGAKVSVAERKGKNREHRQERQIVVSFPPAEPSSTSPGRAMEYEVAAIAPDGAEIVKEYVIATNYFRPCSPVDGDEKCVFGKDSIPEGVKPVWKITPCNYLHQPGRAIMS